MRRILRWVGIVVAGLLGLIVLAFIGLSVAGATRINRTYEVAVEPLDIPSDQAAVDRGRHIAESISLCVGCHGDNLAGSVLDDDQPIVTIAPSNLTAGQGGVGSSFSDADYVRAIRHGLDPDGRPLMIMHSDYYNHLNRQDLAAVIAFIRSMPPVDNQIPATAPGPVGRAMLPLGVFDEMPIPLFPAEVIDHDAPLADGPPPGETAEYGLYLTTIALCTMCHGTELTGGPPLEPEAAAAPSLVMHAAPGGWSAQDFISTLRSGVTPDGRALDAEAMPWEFYAKMTDTELRAIWLYLESLAGG